MPGPAAAEAAPRAGQYAGTVAFGIERMAQGLVSEHMRLRDFYAEAWSIVNPGIPYIPNWHNDLIAEHLEAVHFGQIKRLDVEMPPRFGKSYHVTVAFPVWEWTEDPSERFMIASYNQKLCTRHSLDRRAIIKSNWYQHRWGKFVELAGDQNLKTEFQNTARGHMVTVPFGSSGTGSGGRRLIVDDPLNPKQASSKVQREAAVEFYRNTLSNRLDDEANSAEIIVAQRTDLDDVQGKVVSEKDGWTILRIPIEAPRRMVYTYPISGKQHVYEKGDVLCAARKSRVGIAALRKSMGRSAAAQLDQEPANAAGTLFPRGKWKALTECPAPLFTLTIWDTASKTKEQNDPSAGVTIIKHERGYHFCRGVFNQQVRFGELKKAVRNKYDIERPDALFVEDKSSGTQVIQEMQDLAALPILNFDFPPEDKSEWAEHWRAWFQMDKHARASLVQPLFEAGLISYDPGMENAAEMVEQFAKFPKGDHDDMVDAGVHGLRYLSKMGQQTTEPMEEQDSADGDIADGL